VRRFRRNTLFNLLGNVAPLLVAIVTIPVLIRGLEAERFGILALAWVILGYFGVLDLGIGQALNRTISGKLGSSKEDEIPAIAFTGNVVIGCFGLVAGTIFYIFGGGNRHKRA